MATTEVNIFFDLFRGIREIKPISDPFSGVMSSVSMKNTELRYSQRGDKVGIYTMPGNTIIAYLPNENEVIRGDWESVQQGFRYRIVYTTDGSVGRLYKFDGQIFTLLYDELGSHITCNGLTIAQGLTDYFVFTNGVDTPIAINMLAEVKYTIMDIVDYEARPIRGLGLKSYDGRLAIMCKNRVHWSVQGNIFDFATISSPALATDSAYQEFDREVKAIEYYNDSLIVFTEDYSVAFTGNPADSLNFTRSGASGGGCASFDSLIKFDNKLFYYDHKTKNIFAYYLIDVGQTRPSEGVANEIVNYLNKIDDNRLDEIKIIPCIVEDKSEIWFKLPIKDSKILIMILDYSKGEWVVREQQNINSILVFENNIFTSYENKILLEYNGDLFSENPDGTGGEFIPSEYKFNIINLGSDTDLKTCRSPMTFTVDGSANSDFFVEFVYNDNPETAENRKIIKRFYDRKIAFYTDDDDDLSGGYFVEDDEDIELDSKVFIDNTTYDRTFSVYPPLKFKQLQMRIYTEEPGQSFNIKRIELKKIKVNNSTIW